MSAFLMDLILLCRSASESFQRPAALLNVQFLANGGVTPIRALGGTVGVGLPVATGRAGCPGAGRDASFGGPVPALRVSSDSDFPSTGRLCNEPRSGPSTLASRGAAGAPPAAGSTRRFTILAFGRSGGISPRMARASRRFQMPVTMSGFLAAFAVYLRKTACYSSTVLI